MSMFLLFCMCVCLIGRTYSVLVGYMLLSMPASTVTHNPLFSPAYKVSLVLCYSYNVHKALHYSLCNFFSCNNLKEFKRNLNANSGTFPDYT